MTDWLVRPKGVASVPALIDAHHLGLGQTGNETWARNVVAQLARQPNGHHLAVTRFGLPDVPAHWPADRVHLVSASSARRLSIDLPLVIARSHPDAILVHYTVPPLSTVPAVVVVHDLSFERDEARHWLPARTVRRLRITVRSSARKARVVLTPTQWTRADIVERYGVEPARVLVAPNSVDSALLKLLAPAPQPRSPEPSAPREWVVLCVGTVLPRKNLDVVAHAVSRLRASGLPVTLRLVGPVPDAGRPIVAAISARLGAAVEVVGAVTVDQLAGHYRAARVLAFPSLFEGFGIPLLEAWAAQLPVVSSNATCLPEVGGDAVRYADPSDVEAWVSELAAVLGDEAIRTTLVDAGLRRLPNYDWARTADVVRGALESAAIV